MTLSLICNAELLEEDVSETVQVIEDQIDFPLGIQTHGASFVSAEGKVVMDIVDFDVDPVAIGVKVATSKPR